MTALRPFAVHAAAESRDSAHTVQGASFEDAALAFVDRWHPPIAADGDVVLMITDCETGRAQCLRVDVGEGVTGPCD